MTTVYEAIMRAADHIERNPESYAFCCLFVPCDGELGCMWGHVGRALGMNNDTGNMEVANACGTSTMRLYSFAEKSFPGYTSNPILAAKALRAYANKYHAPAKRDLIPANVREIFSRTYTARDLTV